MARAFDDGAGTVAFGTIGDPNLYSTFSYLAQTVRGLVPGLTIETVPGITAMQDLAARSGTVLAEGDEPLTLLPLTAGTQAFRDALTRPGTVVGYKLGAAAGPPPAEVVTLLATAAAWTAPSSAPAWACPARTSAPPKTCPAWPLSHRPPLSSRSHYSPPRPQPRQHRHPATRTPLSPASPRPPAPGPGDS